MSKQKIIRKNKEKKQGNNIVKGSISSEKQKAQHLSKKEVDKLLQILLKSVGFNRQEEISFTQLTFSHYLIAIFVFLGAFFVYLKTLTPDIGFHDSGDMITSSFYLGICHPPGYPFYNLISKLFTMLIPIGNIAYKMNIFSALPASLAVMMVYFISLKIGGREKIASQSTFYFFHFSPILPAVTAAFALCFAKTFWEQAVVAEKYTLNGLFLTLLIFLLIKWQEAIIEYKNPQSTIRNPQFYLCLFAIVLGFSFTHHLQSIFIVPASIYLVLIIFWNYKKSLPDLKLLLKIFCFFIIPLSLYLYLPLRSLTNPPVNWGSPHTLPNFIDYISLQAYKHFFISNPIIWFKNLYYHLTHFFSNQFTFWLIPFGLLGLFISLKQRRVMGICLLLIALTDIGHSIRYGISNIEDYYIPAFIVFSIWIGISITWLISLISQQVIKGIVVVVLLLPIIPFWANYLHCNHAQYYFAHDLGIGLLKRLQEKAVLLLKGDVNGFPVWYLHLIENYRPDVSLIDTPFLFQNWYAKQIKKNYPQLNFDIFPQNGANELGLARFNDLVMKNYQNYPLYHYSDEPMPTGFRTVPVWFFAKILSIDLPTDKVIKEMADGSDEIVLRRVGVAPSIDAKAIDVIRNCAGGYNNRGNVYLSMNLYNEAIAELNKALKIDPELSVLYYNLGRAYSSKGMNKEAIANFKKVLKINPSQTDIHNNLGMLYEKMGNVEDAISHFKQELSISPRIDTYQSLARIYYKKNDLNEVINQCQQILKLEPNNIETMRNLASLYFKQGRFSEAEVEFKNLLQLIPNDRYALQMLEQISNKRQ